MQDLTILTLDPGTTTGWACSCGDSGAQCFGDRKRAARAEPARHALIASRFQHWLRAVIVRHQPAALVVERQLAHGTGARLLLGLRMVALLEGWNARLLVEEVDNNVWRSWARSRNWVKGDEADALAMLGWWVEQRLPMLVEGRA